jgi:hypothetical protein
MAYRGFAVVACLALAACTNTPHINTDFDPAVSFDQYRTYSWVYTAVPQNMDPVLFQKVRASIDRSLQTRGFTPGAPGDFAVAFTLGRRDRVEITDFGSYGPYYGYGWGPHYHDIDVRQITSGSLVIDIYDTHTRKPIWHAIATKDVTPDHIDQAAIDSGVDAVLAKFPPAPGAK